MQPRGCIASRCRRGALQTGYMRLGAMTAEERERKLVERLTAEAQLASGDYTVSHDPAGIIIDRNGHVKGIWQWRAEAFEWTPAGRNEPTEVVKCPEEAVRLTLQMLGI